MALLRHQYYSDFQLQTYSLARTQFEESASTSVLSSSSSSGHLQPIALDLDCVVEMSQRLSAVLNVEDLISSFVELVVTHANATKVCFPLHFLSPLFVAALFQHFLITCLCV